jgi:hypothetical protein
VNSQGFTFIGIGILALLVCIGLAYCGDHYTDSRIREQESRAQIEKGAK